MEEKVLRMMFQDERLEFMKTITAEDFDWSEATCGFSKEGVRAFLDTRCVDGKERTFVVLYLLGSVVKKRSSEEMDAQSVLWELYIESQQGER